MVTLNARDLRERSPLQALQLDTRLTQLGDSLFVGRWVDSDEREQLTRCALIDLSNLARVGFRGTHAATHLQQLNFSLPDRPNQAVAQSDGGTVLRLSQAEYLLLGSLQDAGRRIQQVENSWALSAAACYLLPRQDSHAWLALTGAHLPELMAKLCGVDLRPAAFARGAVAQTSVARLNAIVVNASTERLPVFYLLCDRASAQYLWGALLDAMAEFAGQPAGVEALLALRA